MTLAVLLAGATTWALDAGQLVVWTTLAIYAGIRALFLGRQVPAGLAFAASSLKITTSLPFLLLPFERRSWRVLLVFGLGVAALCVCLYPPSQLPGMARSHLANVARRVRWARSTIIRSRGLITTTCSGWSTGSIAWGCATAR